MSRLRALTLLLVTLLATAGCTGDGNATAQHPAVVTLPEPTGKYPVGVVDLHLHDPRRAGPDHTPGRDLMLSLWYPAEPNTDAPAADWMPAPTAAYLADQLQATARAPHDRWRLAPLAARQKAAARPLSDRLASPHQLVLLSPGYGMVRGLYAGLAQDLASRGHVVAAVDHPGDAALVTLPDGQLQRQVPFDQNDQAAVQASISTRADDLRFVLDQLDQLNDGALHTDADGQPLPQNLDKLLDTTHTAGVGHSFGGPAVMTAMTTDRRIATGVNLDGSVYPPLTAGISQPVLLFASDGHLLGKDQSWQQWCTSAHPPTSAVVLPGVAHLSFTDLTSILPALHAAGLVSSAVAINTIGSADPATSRQTQTSIVETWLASPSQLDLAHRTAPIQPLPGC